MVVQERSLTQRIKESEQMARQLEARIRAQDSAEEAAKQVSTPLL